MLARLERIPRIDSVDVDHSGTYMRLRISGGEPDEVTAAVVAILRMEGHAGVPLSGMEAERAMERIDAWLGTDAAADLSREEARVLAAEATAAFATERAIGEAASARLRRTIAERLYRSFTATDASAHVGTLIERALPGIVAESRAYLGREDAAALESFLTRWRAAS